MTIAMQPIYTQTVGSGGAGTITFNSIPQTFTDLKIVVSCRSSTSTIDSLYVAFNNDRSSLYSTTYLQTSGGSPASIRTSNETVFTLGVVPPSTYTANTFTNDLIYIPNYTNSSFKSLIADGIAENNSSSVYYLRLNAGLYRSTNPVTRIDIFSGGATFAQYSTFTLYGITKG
jgi:flagellar capping protein FliD